MPAISTGSAELDNEMLLDFSGRPLRGIPRGRLVEVSGLPQSGVSTFCWSVAARCGGAVGWFDADHCGLPLAAQELPCKDVYLCRSAGFNLAYVYELTSSLVPNVACMVIDSWDSVMGEASAWEAERVVQTLASQAAEYGTTILVANRSWRRGEDGREFTQHGSYWQKYASMGLFFPQVGECHITYSRLGVAERGVLFAYSDGFCSASAQSPVG